MRPQTSLRAVPAALAAAGVLSTTLSTHAAAQEVKVNLYSSEEHIPVEITPLRSPTDYLITTKEPIEPGYYAFQTQGLVDSQDATVFNQIPEDLRAVHPFEVH